MEWPKNMVKDKTQGVGGVGGLMKIIWGGVAVNESVSEFWEGGGRVVSENKMRCVVGLAFIINALKNCITFTFTIFVLLLKK